MSNNNNIQDFDNFFKESFSGFEPPAPQGVWESLQTQLGNAPVAGGAGATGMAKAGLWGAGKIILASVATLAVATTTYFVLNTNGEKSQLKDGNSTTEVSTSAQGNTIKPEGETSADDNTATAAEENTTAPQNNPAKPNTVGITTPDKTNTSSDLVTGTHSTPSNTQTPPSNTPAPHTTNHGATDTKTEKQMVGLYLSAQRVCMGQKVIVTIADDLVKNTYRVNFGDGTSVLTQPGKLTTHIYKTGGNYSITATEIGGHKITPAASIEVSEVKAGFEAKNLQKAIYSFSNTSKGATQYQWYFGDGSEMVTETSPVYCYRSFDAKEYRVKLLAINEIGCIDSFVTKIKQTYTYDDLKPKVYNVITPNGDGDNDQFVVEINNQESFQLVIYNRAGQKVFESSDPNISWDGRNKYTGQDCAAGIYRYVLVYKLLGFDGHVIKGSVDLLRK